MPKDKALPDAEVGVNRTPSLAQPTVLFLADCSSDLARNISRGLLASDIFLCQREPSSGPIAAKPALVLSLQTERGTYRSSWHQRCGDLAASWGSAWVTATQIGPRFLFVTSSCSANDQPCYSCVTKCATIWLEDACSATNEVMLSTSPEIGFTAAVLNEAVFQALADRERGLGGREGTTALLYDVAKLSSMPLLLGRVPGCPSCWPAAKADTANFASHPTLAALFEECARTRNNDLRDETSRLPKDLRKNQETVQPRIYLHQPRVRLPHWLALQRRRRLHEGRALHVDQLAVMLFQTFGRWNEADAKRADRVLPSAGNLGSPRVFVINRCVHGLEDGTYAYLEESHELVRVSESGTLYEQMLPGLGLDSSQACPDVILVTVGDYARINVKYGPFAYRLVHFDAGVFSRQICAVADSLGVSLHEGQQWPDGLLMAELSLDPDEVLVLGTIALFGHGPHARDLDQDRDDAFEADATALRYTPGLNGSDVSALVRDLHALSLTESAQRQFAVTDQNHYTSPLAISSKAKVSRSETDLWSQLLTRQSVRSFQDQPVALPTVEKILRDVRNVSGLRAKAPLIKVLATVRFGSRAQPIWETFELSEAGKATRYGTLAFRGSINELFVHPPPARAPLIFWLCGDVRRTPWSYRQMLLEVGRQIYDLMVEADSFCLQGVVVGGIWPKLAGSLLGLRFCDESPLLAFACGHSDSCLSGD